MSIVSRCPACGTLGGGHREGCSLEAYENALLKLAAAEARAQAAEQARAAAVERLGALKANLPATAETLDAALVREAGLRAALVRLLVPARKRTLAEQLEIEEEGRRAVSAPANVVEQALATAHGVIEELLDIMRSEIKAAAESDGGVLTRCQNVDARAEQVLTELARFVEAVR